MRDRPRRRDAAARSAHPTSQASFDARVNTPPSATASPAELKRLRLPALRSDRGGGAEAARRRRRFGLYAQYFAVGVVYGGLPQTMYGFFLGYLNVDAYVYATATTIVALPWSFKFLFGAINDVLPIGGERRRPYIFLGWAVCALALWALAATPLPEPYWCVEEDEQKYKKFTTTKSGRRVAAAPCNPAAPGAGAPFALWMMVASFGF